MKQRVVLILVIIAVAVSLSCGFSCRHCYQQTGDEDCKRGQTLVCETYEDIDCSCTYQVCKCEEGGS